MRHRAQPGVGQRHLVRVGLDVGLQFGQGVGRKVLAPEQRHWHIDHLADVFKILQRIKRQLFVQRRRSGHAHVVDKDGVSVGRGARDLGGSNGAAGAHRVFDQHRLAKRLAHGNGDHARHHIGRTTRRERHDQRDRPVWKRRLREGGRHEACSKRRRPGHKHGLEFEFHLVSFMG